MIKGPSGIDDKGTIHEVRTLKFGDFEIPPSLLYAFKQYNGVINIIDARFFLDSLPPSLSVRTLWMAPRVKSLHHSMLELVVDFYPFKLSTKGK